MMKKSTNDRCGDCKHFECCEYYDWDTYDEYIKHSCSRHPEASVRIDEDACEDFEEGKDV